MALFRWIAIVAAITVAEFYVTVYKVPQLIGAPMTIALLVASSLLGVTLLKHQGRAVWRRFSAAVSEHRMPHREAIDGVLVIFGGACLILPGFVTDAIGLFLLLPATRPVARRLLERRLSRRGFNAVAGGRARRRAAPADFDVEGTATDYSTVGANRLADEPDRQLRR